MNLIRNKYVISTLAGILLPFAFAPMNYWLLAFISPLLLLYSWLDRTPKQAFWQGLLFGIGLFTVGTSWVYISVHHFGNANVFLASLITALLILLMSSYHAIQGFIFARIAPRVSFRVSCLAVFPLTWLLAEYLRTYLFTGFPWLLLGVSQTNGWLNNLAPIFGTTGISWLICTLSSSLLFLIFTLKNKDFLQQPYQVTIVSAILIFYGLMMIGSFSLRQTSWTHASQPPITVSLIQGNVPEAQKWDANFLPGILQRYAQLTNAHWASEIIVWPEAALPVIPQQATAYLAGLSQAAKQHNSTVLLGAPNFDSRSQQYFNSLIMLGANQGLYQKIHLVPFGEYTPLSALFAPILNYFQIPWSNFSAGSIQQKPLQVGSLKVAPFICYEIAYSDAVRDAAAQSQLLVVISDDSWFGNSWAGIQQLQMAQMRARELGRAILYSTNTGITAVINSVGQVTQQIPTNQVGVLTAVVQPMQGETPYRRYKNYPLLALVFLQLVWIRISRARRQKRA